MKNETKRAVAQRIYRAVMAVVDEVRIMRKPILIGLLLMVVFWGFSLISDIYHSDMWLATSPLAFVAPILVAYVIRLKRWVMKWKDYKVEE